MTTASAESDGTASARDSTRRVTMVPARRVYAGLLRDPLGGLTRIGRDNDGTVVRLNLGVSRPYLLAGPEHVQRVLGDKPTVYRREGMLWKPLRRLEGDGIAGEGPGWERSRRILQPLFTAKSIARITDQTAEAVTSAVDALASRSAVKPTEITAAMTGLAHRALIRAFFGDRIHQHEASTLGSAISTAMASLNWRILLAFAPDWTPLPGDRRFGKAVREIDQIVYPLLRRARAYGEPRDDIVSLLATATDANGNTLTEKQIRDDVVSMFVAGTETTALVLTWLWILLDTHPAVARRLRDEVRHTLGDDPPRARHLPKLSYTRMAVAEALRLYPVGWLIPRRTAEPDTVDGVRIPAGATVIVSPYVTHRLPRQWDHPDEFEPMRFAARPGNTRHKFAYMPFGGGMHHCLGSHFFTVEAQLIVAAMASRHWPSLTGSAGVEVRTGAVLKPRRPVSLVLPRYEPGRGR